MLVFGAVLTGIVFLIQEEVMPASNYQAEELRNRMRGGTARTFDVLNRRWIVGRQGQIYHYVYYDPRRRELNQLSIYEFDVQSWRLSRRTHVARAVWDPASSEKQPRWSATDGWVREFRAGGADVGEYSTFQTKTLALEAPDYFGTEQPDSERMNYVQLKKYIGYLRAGGFDVTKPEVALQQKLAFPFIPLIMTLIAIPFAVTTGRRGALYGIGIGIVLAMVYWISSQVFAAIGSGGLVVPLLAAWAPNILFAGSAAYLLLTVRT
jgi:lipopolysaccharide export LptBFGC system permease protein LptF